MKLQGMGIVFALVIVPIMLVLSYYIGLQVDTIELQTKYDSKLLDSTYDAMAAFELNTANEDLSTVSDSLRTIIEASYNVFISNLATNLGISNANKTYIEPYIPAVLYTLYDGYYICAPTKVPTVCTDSDGNAVAVGDNGVTGTSGNYSYIEPTDTSIATYLNENVGLDYGQLLYLKDVPANDNYENEKNDETKQSQWVWTADINDAKLETKNVLKTYMPYSARYTDNSTYNLTIIYTLDNFVTIEGNIGNVYYTKSGYLIPDGSVTINIMEQPDGYSTDVYDYSQSDIEDAIENGVATFEVVVNDGTNTSFSQAVGVSKDSLNTKLNVLNNLLEDAQEIWNSAYYKNVLTAAQTAKDTFTENYFSNLHRQYDIKDWSSIAAQIQAVNEPDTDAGKTEANKKVAEYLKKLINEIEEEINDVQYQLDKMSSIEYYAKAYIFSRWVQEYLCSSGTGKCNVLEDDLVEVAGQKYTTIKEIETLEFNFTTGRQVFSLTGTEPVSVTEISTDSAFYQHKLEVIQMSIQYNLNLAMSTYNQNESYSFEYEMPVIQADEWEQILSHISITTFMQGKKCGLKTYNNYKIVSSTNNDILTLPDEIYYVAKGDFNDESSEYHRINCNKLIEADTDSTEYMAFSSKEVKYDKIYNKNRDYMTYEYDHKNYACYECINDSNYFDVDTDGDGKNDSQINIFDQSCPSYTFTDSFGTTHTYSYADYKNLRKAYYIGVGKERNDTYKMNAFEDSQGYEVIKDTNISNLKSGNSTTLSADRIDTIEISVGTIYSQNSSISTALYSFDYGSVENLSNDSYSIATNNSSNNSTQTVKIKVLSGKDLGSDLFNVNSTNFKPVCDNADDILKVTNAGTDSETTENAVTQFKKQIKYVRVIYK